MGSQIVSQVIKTRFLLYYYYNNPFFFFMSIMKLLYINVVIYGKLFD